MRRLLIGVLVLGVVLAGVFAFAANLNLSSVKVTVFSNTLASPTLDTGTTPSDTVQAGVEVTASATLGEDPDFLGGLATAGGTVTYRLYEDGTCTTLHPTLHLAADTKTVVAGIVPASDPVTITLSGPYSWRASYSGDGNNQPATGDCQILTVTAADPAKLAFDGDLPASTEAGIAFSSQPKVNVLDTYDNVVTTFTNEVHLAITPTAGDPAAVLSCTPDNDLPAVAGIATFTGCTIDKADGALPDYTLTATSGALVPAVSNAFVITPGLATKLVITGSATQAAGATNDLTVTAKDNFDNTATAYSGTKSLTFSGAAASAGPITDPVVKDKDGTAVKFGQSTPLTFVQGVAQAVSGVSNGAMVLYKAEVATIAATDGTISTGVPGSLSVTVSAGAADKLAFTQMPGNSVAGDAFASQPTVAVQDAYGNVVTTSSADIRLALTGGDPTAALDCDGATNDKTASSGIAEFSGCFIDKAEVGYELVASSTALDDATSDSFEITGGSAARFVLAAVNTTQVAGAANNLTITAQDDFGNTAESYDGDKTLQFTGAGNPVVGNPGTAPKVTSSTGTAVPFESNITIHFVDGVAQVSGGNNGVMTLYMAETAHIGVSDALAGIETEEVDELNITVTPAPFAVLDLKLTSPQPNGGIFSGAENTVTALDTYGNLIKNFNAATTNVTLTANAPLSGTITRSSGDGNNVLNQGGDFVLGIADLNSLGVKYTGSLGTGTFTASAAGPITDDSGAVTIEAGAAAKFVITAGSSTLTAGDTLNITITAKDANGNTATGYAGPKALTLTGANPSTNPVTDPTVTSGGSPADFGAEETIQFVAGVATLSGADGITLYKAEEASIVATADSITTTGTDRLTVTVSAAAADKLLFDQQPSDANTNAAITPAVTVRVQDAYGNPITTATSVSVAIDNNAGPGATLSGTATQNSSGGVATFNSLTIDLPGIGYTLKATSGSLDSDTSASFDIAAPP